MKCQFQSRLLFPLKTGNFYNKFLCKKCVLNSLPNYKRNTIGCCSHNNRERKNIKKLSVLRLDQNFLHRESVHSRVATGRNFFVESSICQIYTWRYLSFQFLYPRAINLAKFIVQGCQKLETLLYFRVRRKAQFSDPSVSFY